jgi:competence protein ComEC
MRIFTLKTIFLLFLFNLISWYFVFEFSKEPYLTVYFFNVGEGDGILIQTPFKNQILIDGGPDSKILEKLSKVMPFWDKTIEVLILTHPDKDHLTGQISVLKHYKVENLIWNGLKSEITEYKEWENLVQEKQIKIFKVQDYKRVKEKNLILTFLWPKNSSNFAFQNSNDFSIVAKLKYYQNSFLFTGDISSLGEKALISLWDKKTLESQVLKVAHHGSKYSTSEEFLLKVQPEFAVISVGKDNPYFHPHFQTLENLKKHGTTIFRTDLNGDIKFFGNGQIINYEFSNI